MAFSRIAVFSVLALTATSMIISPDATSEINQRSSLTLKARSSSGSTSGKRGLAYNNNNPDANAEYANLFVGYSSISWGYDWGYPSWSLNYSFEL